MNDAMILAATLGMFCLVLAALAVIADWWDEDHNDARRRNR